MLGRAGHRWGARYVYDQHDANPELAEAKWGSSRIGRALVRFTRALESRSYRAAHLVIVPNDSYASIARRRGGVDPARLSVIRNAPASGFRALADGREPPPGRTFIIGYLGVIGAKDGVELLVDAVGALCGVAPTSRSGSSSSVMARVGSASRTSRATEA